ncbi:MAG: Lrp/AsnC family transcriptional regulator [Candidatus Nitrosopumilus sp. MTA1]|uniref:Lrp/AsnC ligand binding domain-containing protein n=1 Tax=Marine Group I thaumarchaeote TaxID=2511932 RepID=A0A7K4N6E6_9ARCH|nr:MAG: Lrp/AsnC family transcriptional regulator [Nitrosopumilus sp. YT1]NMI82832.1 Lrp/AsnC family transcriptional regulator [Candidatus Nitrosopumilus sp. MTA1]NWJ28830.1 Lrp/AsnC ligand binding domain-containing protein [Marine Group I thaumarchaeote]NWJ57441.1 Lrp/AsnC ligand binding domain-containing protein [Marine Group I thaumarchaeote]NWJ83800.1 Lrp/AsnC ligand binding domain-containing protein [Marine Group I thaumarchaeote]
MVRAIILVKSPKKLIAARLRKVSSITESFPTSGQFDAVAIIEVEQLIQIKEVANQIQKINGVERTETMVEVQ